MVSLSTIFVVRGINRGILAAFTVSRHHSEPDYGHNDGNSCHANNSGRWLGGSEPIR